MSFIRQLQAILFRIAFPKLRSKETGIVVLHSFFLVMRTILSIAVARLDGMIVRDLVSKHPLVLGQSMLNIVRYERMGRAS